MRFSTSILLAIFSIASLAAAEPQNLNNGLAERDSGFADAIEAREPMEEVSSPRPIQNLSLHPLTRVSSQASYLMTRNLGKPGRLCPGEKATGTDEHGFACVLGPHKTCKSASQKCASGAFKAMAEKALAAVKKGAPAPKKAPNHSRDFSNPLLKRDMCTLYACEEQWECPRGCTDCFGDRCLNINAP
jgi:hypothetical protein